MEQPGTLTVDASFNPLSFFLYLVKPTVEIDGEPNEATWGPTVFSVAPGPHRITVWFKYITGRAGANSVDVDVPSGGGVHVRYRAPWVMFSPGKISAS